MGKDTKIEWCHHTFNCWRGCTKVSAGCAHCYAETLSHRNPAVLGQAAAALLMAVRSQYPVEWALPDGLEIKGGD